MARVLVVQEAGAERRAMQTALEDEGYEVLLSGTGAQAVAAVSHVRVDVIIVHADSVQDGGVWPSSGRPS